MEKKKHGYGKYFLLLGIFLALLLSVGGAISVFADGLNIDRSQSSFVVGSLRYYHISGNPTNVAVAYAGNSINDVYTQKPSSSWELTSGAKDGESEVSGRGSGVLQVPHTVSVGLNSYTVTAVAPTGFRRTGFSEIRLPETITELGAEAFYACESLTKFILPCLVTEIPASAFMDCRNLQNIYYSSCSESNATVSNVANWTYWSSGSEEGYGIANSKITSIADHAFTSCIKLSTFSFPTSLTSIGFAAFQDCRSFTYIMFVTWANHSTKNIQISSYAFADCTAMTLFFFAKNVQNIGAYAFARCERLTLYYNGVASDYSGYTTNWRKKHPDLGKTNEIADFVPFRTDYSDISQDSRYPGLFFVVGNANITLDQWTKDTKAEVKTIFTPSSGEYYATILSFATPDESTTPVGEYQYYDKDKGKLMLPDSVNAVINDVTTSCPIRVIEQNAFLGNTDLKKIRFNASLIQICRYAFYGCSNIDELNFSIASSLKEISYKVFQDDNIEANYKLTSLTLPTNLLIIGAQAFYNFRKVSSFSIPSNSKLENICQQAFAYLGADIENPGTVDLVLPKSLNDDKNKKRKPQRLSNGTYGDNDNAVMREAFLGAKALRTVKVGWSADSELKKDNRIGFGSGCFKDCTSLLRFTSNRNHYIMGYDMFAGCSSLRELFISMQGTTHYHWSNYPWGVDDGKSGWKGSLFDNNTCPDLAIYIYENAYTVWTTSLNGTPPGTQGNPQNNGMLWNTNPHFSDSFVGIGNNQYYATKPTYPTYFGVQWNDNTAVQYHPIDNSGTTYNIETVMGHLSEPMYAFIGDKLTRAYCNLETVDLSTHSSITQIGYGSFAYGGSNFSFCPGKNIILPASSISTIEPYAFARTDDFRLTSITYGNNTSTYSKYCILPSGINSIGRFAFFNHAFSYINIHGSLSFLGNGAFLGGSVSSFSFANNTNELSISGNYIYYSGTNGAQKTLLYLFSYNENSGILDLSESGIIGIAPHALEKSKYEAISLPTSLKTIYGQAMYKNTSVKTIDIPKNSALTYIGYAKRKPNDDANFSSLPFDIRNETDKENNGYYDYAASAGAFFGCSNLTTFNFLNIKTSTLKKIGLNSFRGCGNLEHMTGGASYKYYTYTYDSISSKGSISLLEERDGSNANDGVLDLSQFTSLTSIGGDSFNSCSKIAYAHIPKTQGLLYFGYDGDETFQSVKSKPFPNGTKILFGEGAKIVCPNSTDALRDGTRYPAEMIDKDNANNCYYYAQYKEDVLDSNSVCYWTVYEDGYLLFSSSTDARTYLNPKPED